MNRSRYGFTLVEIMLAAAILVAVMAAFLSSFTSTFKSTNYSQGISLAGRAAENKVEEMINFTFDSLMAQYGANGTGRNFTFNASGLTGAGIVNVTDRKDLYAGGETLVADSVGCVMKQYPVGLVYDNRMWILGGSFRNDVWYSYNGSNWTCATNAAAWPVRMGQIGLVYDNKMWILGGVGNPGYTYRNDVWYSYDGVNWICATNAAAWPARAFSVGLVYDNRMWILGGYNPYGGYGPHIYKNDVWYSYDGVNWICATNAAAWPARQWHASLVYDNKMWIMGGLGFGGYTNDVWYSHDGVNWTCATNATAWPARRGLSSLVYDNKMWIMGGQKNVGLTNDVWYSHDGVNWTCASNAAAWSARKYHISLAYDNKMWIMSGWTDPGYPDDVWSSTGYNRILEADIAVSWKHPDNRTFGEDVNFDGVWDNATEDVNGNGIYDSPARLRQLLVEDSTTGKLRRIYMGR